MQNALEFFLAPFRIADQTQQRFHLPLLLIFLMINGLVCVNTILHDPTIEYDAQGHLANIRALANFRLPSSLESVEYFSPPLPYLFPAALMIAGVVDWWQAAKLAQLLNVLLSLGTTFYMLKICDVLEPERGQSYRLKLAALIWLSLLPVWYRTFSFVRGEPFVIFFAVLVAHQSLIVFTGKGYKPILLGVALGLLVLSRQWGFFLFPALILFVGILALKQRMNRIRLLRALLVSLVIAALVGGWFYLHLFRSYGTFTAFNRDSAGQFSLANQPPEFYFGLGLDQLFSDPVRPSFANQFIPMLYADMWGDYWCFFSVYGIDTRSNTYISGLELMTELAANPAPDWLITNRYTVNSYLRQSQASWRSFRQQLPSSAC